MPIPSERTLHANIQSKVWRTNVNLFLRERRQIFLDPVNGFRPLTEEGGFQLSVKWAQKELFNFIFIFSISSKNTYLVNG